MTKCAYFCCIVNFPFLSKVESNKYAVAIFSPIGSADVQVFKEFGAGFSLSCISITCFFFKYTGDFNSTIHNEILGLKN